MKTAYKIAASFLVAILLLIFAVHFADHAKSNSAAVIAAQNTNASAKGLDNDSDPKNPTHIAAYGLDILQVLDNGLFITTGSRYFAPSKDESAEIAHVATLNVVQAGSYKVRFLDFIWRGHPLGMFWLKNNVGDADLIYAKLAHPEEYDYTGLMPGKLYSIPDFLATLQNADKLNKQRDAAEAAAGNARIAAIVAENRRKVASGEDTPRARLEVLDKALDTALAALKQAPAGFFDQSMADIGRAQAGIAQGLDYIKSHPEEDKFSLTDKTERLRNGIKIYASASIIARNDSAAATLPTACDAMQKGLENFVGSPFLGQPVLAELGGNRDLIMREVAFALIDLSLGINKLSPTSGSSFGRTLPVVPVAINTVPSASNANGAISGRVQLADGTPDDNIIISYETLGQDEAAALVLHTSQLTPVPATIPDKNGNFYIKNLPPGFYLLPMQVGEKPGSATIIEVKAGVETKLTTPLVFVKTGGGTGG